MPIRSYQHLIATCIVVGHYRVGVDLSTRLIHEQSEKESLNGVMSKLNLRKSLMEVPKWGAF